MKIGQVVKEFGIPVTRLYFYINKGLLIPERYNNQYIFNQGTIEDIKWLLDLQKMHFSLKDIEKILTLKRISGFITPESREKLKRLYLNQEIELMQRRNLIEDALKELDGRLNAVDNWSTPEAPQTGVPLEMLHLCCCPNCKEEFSLGHAVLNQRYIYDAEIFCGNCGYKAEIKNGILCMPNENTSRADRPNPDHEAYYRLPPFLINLFERSYYWLERSLTAHPQHGRVWLESYVNGYFYFHNHLHLLDETDSLIVVDKFPETLLSYKRLIEMQKPACKILYIADVSTNYPIKDGTVDCCMDFFASNEHNHYFEGFYLKQIKRYLKTNAAIFGSYFYYRRKDAEFKAYIRSYPEASVNNFDQKWFRAALEKDFRIAGWANVLAETDEKSNLEEQQGIQKDNLCIQLYRAFAK